jgi:DNA mismatch repair protein MutS
VAICEQVEDPAEAKGIVRRAVVETVTPGAVLADALLSERRNNYLLAVCGGAADGAPPAARAAAAIAVAGCGHLDGRGGVRAVRPGGVEAGLARFEAAELLLPADWMERDLPGADGASRTYRPDWLFDPELGREEAVRRYHVRALEGFGFEPDDAPCSARSARCWPTWRRCSRRRWRRCGRRASSARTAAWRWTR